MTASSWRTATGSCAARVNCWARGRAAIWNSTCWIPGNAELIKEAQFEARTLVEEDPELQLPEHQLLAAFVGQLYPADSDIS